MGKTKGRPSQPSQQSIALQSEAIKQIKLMGAFGRKPTISRLAVRLGFNLQSMPTVRSLVKNLEEQGAIQVIEQKNYQESVIVLLGEEYGN